MPTTSRHLLLAAITQLTLAETQAAMHGTSFAVTAEVVIECAIATNGDTAPDIHCSNGAPSQATHGGVQPAPFSTSESLVENDSTGLVRRITITF